MFSRKLIEEIEKFSNYKLKRKDDLGLILEVGTSNLEKKEIEDLTFNAKYILGLQRVLKKGSLNPEVNNLEKIKNDYSENIIKITEQIGEIINFAPEEKRAHLKETYLELNQQSFQNLNELLEDLEWAKMYLNNKKRQ